jgi:hypothetical protein
VCVRACVRACARAGGCRVVYVRYDRLTVLMLTAQMVTFFTVRNGKMVELTRRIIVALGGDGFGRSKHVPGFQLTAQLLNFMGMSNLSGTVK